ncbi:uncharacterized protein N7518_000772 [Penicillium psychrosexuale]|uniref:uncharacterized protein n=1 Tax=Penicillium psychrosexuale TaxID=1002107 RepID=UPI0025455331|nr:uncharacterized protein N7518_000772 [Penicillium psychrosexuale]KAJ5804469.1 hypothetical protein N7518_000772 [Penicillium psychrosexuale]
MGFTGVSFYIEWSLLEGNHGHVITDGIWSLDEFFDAASQAGLYLIARPGPYINAETTAGGIPGWVLREKGVIRSDNPEYLNATANYMSTLGRIIERGQITNGGPVIMVQPENEYSTWPGVTDFLTEMNRNYMAYVEEQLLDEGLTVPSIVNDNLVMGYFAPGSGKGAVDIYAIDAYPMRYDCELVSNAQILLFGLLTGFHMTGKSRTDGRVQRRLFRLLSSKEGLVKDGLVQDMYGRLVNEEAVRVVYKNNYNFGVKIFNIYMTRPRPFVLFFLSICTHRRPLSSTLAPTDYGALAFSPTYYPFRFTRDTARSDASARSRSLTWNGSRTGVEPLW